MLLTGEDYLVCRGALWKLLTHSSGKFNVSAGDLDTWCASERVDIARGLTCNHGIIILIHRIKNGLNLKSVQRKDNEVSV